MPSLPEVKPVDERVENIFRELLREGRETFFEDGMDNEVSKKVMIYIPLFREQFLNFMWRQIHIYENLETISYILNYIGHLDAPVLRDERRNLLEYYLINSRSSRVRDSASIGLSSMDDPKSLPCIRMALARERVDMLQKWYWQIIEQLIETQNSQKEG